MPEYMNIYFISNPCGWVLLSQLSKYIWSTSYVETLRNSDGLQEAGTLNRQGIQRQLAQSRERLSMQLLQP